LTTLSALLAAAPAQASYGPSRGAYAGSTAQKHPMSVTLSRSGRTTSRLFVRLDARCPSSNQIRWETIEIDATPIHRDGRFSDGGVVEGNTKVGDTVLNFRVKVKGRVRRRGAKGTARLAGIVKDLSGKVIDNCDSGIVKWTLRRGAVYAGATRDGTAVGVRTTRTRRTVKSFSIDWLVTCGSAGDINASTHLNVPVDADGRFAKEGTVRFVSPQGPTVNGHFALKGRLGLRKASGNYRVSGTALMPNGSTVNCDTGTIKWSARRG
jgi:hypothetical protein